MRLTDSLDEQSLLEAVLEESKPALPAAVRRLHYLLATPYRYRPHLGSRFRAPLEPGVWYGAEALRTALAEKSYWRLRFLLDSPATPDVAVLDPGAFGRGRPRSLETWFIAAARTRVRCALQGSDVPQFEFSAAQLTAGAL